MLGSDGLFEFQRVVDFVDIDTFVAVNELDYLETQRMRKCPQYLRRQLELLAVDVYLSVFHGCCVIIRKILT